MSDAPEPKKAEQPAEKKCCPGGEAAPVAEKPKKNLGFFTVTKPDEFADYCLVEEFGNPFDGMIRVKLRGTSIQLEGFSSPPETWVAAAQGPVTIIPQTPTTTAKLNIGIARKVVDPVASYDWGQNGGDSYIYLVNACDLGAPKLVYTVVVWHIYKQPFNAPFHTHVLIETAKFEPNCPNNFEGCQ